MTDIQQFPQARHYVGRLAVVQAVAHALRRIREEHRCFAVYIESAGGLGKSFLLLKLPELLSNTVGDKAFAVARIIDLSDSDTRRGLVVEQMLIDGLRRNAGQWYRFESSEVDRAFGEYQRARELYEQERARLSPKELEKRREALQDLFVRSLNRLADRHPIVLRFDTTETLTSGQIANEFLRDAFPTSTRLFLDWLLAVMPRLRSVLIIFSGRPPQQPDDTQIDTLLVTRGLLAVEKQTLHPLEPDEIREYMLAYGQPAPSEAENVRIWEQTEGHPLLITSLIERRLSTTRGPLSAVRGLKEFKDDLLEEVLNPIAHREDHDRRIFSYCLYVLSFARRGISREQLATCLRELGYTEIPDTMMAISDQRLNTVLNRLSSSALVKVRPLTNLLYLHDEIFVMIDESERPELLGMDGGVLGFLIRMSEEQLAIAERSSGSSDQAQSRSDTFIAWSNLIYYRLMHNVDEGYRTYLLVMDQLFNRREAALALSLRDEFMRWLSLDSNKQRLQESKLELAEVARDDAVWLVKYNLQIGRNSEAVDIGMRIRERLGDEIEKDDYFKYELYVTLGNALTIYRDAEQSLTEQLFDEVLALFERPQLNQEYMRNRRDYFAALAYLYAGFLYRTLADYNRAAAYYVRSRQHFEAYIADPNQKQDFNTLELHTQVTINLAFIDGQQGNYMRARALLRRLREPVTFGRLSPDRQAVIANVESIVYLNSDNMQLALRSVQEAWRIATSLEDRRIRGQVAHQYANVLHEIMKRSRVRDLHAENYFRDAEEIFAQEATARREALIDHGKYARNLALLYRRDGDEVNAQRHFTQASECFQAALAAVGADVPTLQRAEILECQAVIERMSDHFIEAEELLAAAEADLAAQSFPAYAQVVAATIAFERGQIALVRRQWVDTIDMLVIALARAFFFSHENRTVKAFISLSEQYLSVLPPDALAVMLERLLELRKKAEPVPVASLPYQHPADHEAWNLAVGRSVDALVSMLAVLAEVGGLV